MTPTQQDIQTLAYFEVIDRNRRGANIDEILSQLAQGADRSLMTKSTLWHGWLANGTKDETPMQEKSDRAALTDLYAWRRDTPPRGVRCLVTWRGRDGRSLPRVRVASVSPDHEEERWFSEEERLHHVVAWMPLPRPASDEVTP